MYISKKFTLSELQKSYYFGQLGTSYLGNINSDGLIVAEFAKLDSIKFEKAVNKVVNSHEMLRAAVLNETYGVIYEQLPEIKIDIVENSNCDIEALASNAKTHVFDMTKVPCFSFKIIKQELTFKLFFHFGLFFLDASSWFKFIDEVVNIYNGCITHDDSKQINLGSFGDYTAKIALLYETDAYTKSLEYWKSKDLTAGRPGFFPINQLNEAEIKVPLFKSLRNEISFEICAKLRDKCKLHHVSTTSAFLAAYAHTIMKWSNANQVIINMVASDKYKLNNVLGNYAKPLPLLIKNQPQPCNISQFISEIRKRTREDIRNQVCSISDIVSLANQSGSNIKLPLFPIVFTPLHPLDECFGLEQLNGVRHIFSISKTAQVWLDNQIYYTAATGSYIIHWDYVEQIFEHSIIEAMHKNYCDLIEYLANADWEQDSFPNFQIPAEDLLLIEHANSSIQEIKEQTLFAYCADYVSRYKQMDKVAVIDNSALTEVRYSYTQLLSQSELLAKYIVNDIDILSSLSPAIMTIARARHSGHLIAILSEKGYTQIISSLAIMQAGYGYLPLNVDWPLNRLDEVLNEGGVSVILISKQQHSVLEVRQYLASKYRLLVVEELLLELAVIDSMLAQLDQVHLPEIRASDIAYVIFTSGSTGKPKGVTISHAGALNTILAINNKYTVTDKDRILALSELSFDLSVYDMFGILGVGGTIVFPSQAKNKDPGHWLELINRHQITVWNTVPQLADLFIDSVYNSNALIASLRLFLLSGDWIPVNLPNHIVGACHKAQVISLGGATEGSIWSIWYEITQIDSRWTKIPYGVAMPNQKMYVLNDELGHCQVGVVGEIYIGGFGVALGYWQDEVKTRTSFISHPLGRLYRTGDLGRWHSNGYIDFMGRIDDQIKLNGYRIELREIESKLSQLAGITEAAVTIQNYNNHDYIAAYLLPQVSEMSQAVTSESRLDKETFKLAQIGIRSDLELGIKLDLRLEQSIFCLRKSYRRYLNDNVDLDILNMEIGNADSNIMRLLKTGYLNSSLHKVKLDKNVLAILLAQISCIRLNNRILPKYLYPSAGSSYAVRCYINLGYDIYDGSNATSDTQIRAGYYYYNPLTTSLIPSKPYTTTIKESTYLELIVHWPAITPLYNKSSRDFAYIEVGHIMNLILNQCRLLGLMTAVDFCDEELDLDNHLLARIMLGDTTIFDKFFNIKNQLALTVYSKDLTSKTYYSTSSTLDLSRHGILFEADPYSGGLLAEGGALITFSGESAIDSLIYLGLYAQELNSSLCHYDYGSCMLGYKLNPDMLCAMVVGLIDKSDEALVESMPKVYGLKNYIEYNIKNILPEYMLPHDYMILEQLPLTVNGKLDYKRLPLLNFVAANEYIAPRNQLETKMLVIYAEVLGLLVDQVGITDDFFRLGGDSIFAIRLVHQLNQCLNLHLSVKDIFILKTVERISMFINNGYLTDTKHDLYINFSLVDYQLYSSKEDLLLIEDIYPASLLQVGMLFESNIKDDTVYHEMFAYKFTLEFDLDKFMHIWMNIVNAHALLRAKFVLSDNTYDVVVYKNINIEHTVYNNHNIQNLINSEQLHGFDYERAGLFRLLINKCDDHFDFIFSFHHAIADGWSIAVLIEEFISAYCMNKPLPVSTTLSYAQFIKIEQANILDVKNKIFWNSYLDNAVFTDIRWKSKNVIKHSTELYRKFITIDNEASNKLRILADNLSVSIDSIFLSAYLITISQFVNQSDIIVGLIVNNRLEQNGGDRLFGLFLNTIPYRFDTAKIMQNLNSGILGVFNEKLKLYDYKGYPYNEIKTLFGKELYQFAFNFANFHIITNDKNSIMYTGSYERTSIPVVLNVVQDGTYGFNLSIVAQYDFIDDEYLIYFSQYLKYNLNALINDSSNLGKICAEDYETQFYIWNKTNEDYSDKTIHDLFIEQVERTPNIIALIYDDIKLTYIELNHRANQLAHYLRNTYNIQGDDLIALCLDRSEHMLISILGVLKSGAAYVPIDPNYPDERIEYMLEDTQAKVILTNDIYVAKLTELSLLPVQDDEISAITANQSSLPSTKDRSAIHALDNAKFQALLAKQESSNPKIKIMRNNLAYVIYTSGTTGNPKGVMIEHGGLVNLTIAQAKEFGLYSTNELLQKNCLFYANFMFDAHVSELFTVIICGHCLHIIDNNKRHDLELLSQYIEDMDINIATLPPLLLNVDTILKLDLLIVAGDISDPLVMRRYLEHGCKLINAYGPTETTVCASLRHVRGSDSNTNIGKPISNTVVYILNADLTPLPFGVIGELYIGGAGLARGYLNQPELTADKFISNPFQTDKEKQQGKNSRLYKTGDLVRYLPDGNIEYIGRNDFQVKIRGFRIELGEIESKLSQYPGVRHAVVLTLEHEIELLENIPEVTYSPKTIASKYLVGYYVALYQLDEDAILRDLSTHLPGYMVPNVLVYLESLPLTLNGKLDHKALPKPDFINKDNYIVPRNELETTICNIYAQVLGLPVDKIGINHDFFKLGGNSILAIKLAHQISKVLDIKLVVADVFRVKTIEELVSYINSTTAKSIVIPLAPAAECHVLSFAQERLWFIEQYEQGSNVYHIPMLFKLEPNVDIPVLVKSLQAIVSRHEVLRSIFIDDESGADYQVVKTTPLEIPYIICTSRDEYLQQAEIAINQVFNLRAEYPIRVCIYEINTATIEGNKNTGSVVERYLLINIHHIAGDGWSIDVFQRELLDYYTHYMTGKTLSLPALSIQYKDFALWQRSYLSGSELDKQLSYWQKRLSGYEILNLATDKPRPSQVSYAGSQVTFSLSEELSNKLRVLAKSHGYTMYTVLLSGFYLLLNKYTNQNDIIVGSATANRHYGETQNLIGFFVNMLVQREQLDVNQPLSFLIKQIHTHLVEAQLHQDLPFEKLVEEMKVERDASRHPLFQVMFTVQSFADKVNAEWDNIFRRADINDLHAVTRFDLECFIDDAQSLISGSMVYATSLFHHETIERFTNHYINILSQIAEADDKLLKDYHILSQSEYQQIVYEWNQTEKSYPTDKLIHQLFEEQVQRTPDNIAVVYEGVNLSYIELNQRSNQLAHYLRSTYQIQGDDLIALCLDRSEYMLIAILGTLKAGAAYVPIDPSYPDERISYILADTQAKVVLNNEVYKSRLNTILGKKQMQHSQTGDAFISKNSVIFANTYLCEVGINAPDKREVLTIDNQDFYNEILTKSASNPELAITSSNLAYVIYTSGTTGNPKGVMIEHKSLVNYTTNIKDLDIVKMTDIVDFSTNISFDLSLTTTICALCLGARISPYLNKLSAIEQYKQHLLLNDITVIKLVPGYFELLIDFLPTSNIKIIILGGEKLGYQTINKLKKAYVNKMLMLPNVYDEYGPTETTVGACIKRVKINDPLTIGTPYANNKSYILDANCCPLPIGATGELYLGGTGLARGYLNQPELTAEKFIANPFQTNEEKQSSRNSRLYKTGDLVRYLPDGNIDYIGRNDFQVKIRGFRIELGEIENALINVRGIKQACVISRERINNSNQINYLLGYYILDNTVIVNQDNGILNGWENLYDSEYSKTIINSDIMNVDFSGWNSFITGKSIPLQEMQLWRDATVTQINKLQPQSILEIGVGSGLLMYPLLETVDRYVGLDISSIVIKRHQEYLQDKQSAKKVGLYHLSADKIDEVCIGELFDCIVLNSVCQYFPSIIYFEDVVAKALAKLKIGGSLFIGDVRNYDLHRSLIEEKLSYEQVSYTEAEVKYLQRRESELLISPEYFLIVKDKLGNIKVNILDKSTEYNNELSKYRYDVVLTVSEYRVTIPVNDELSNNVTKQCYNVPFLNKLTSNHIMVELKQTLPDYMIPEFLIEIDALPLTINGKLDRKALPDPDCINKDYYVAPQNELEVTICSIYAEILGFNVIDIGINAEFFKLGGNSILAIRLAHQISKVLDIKLVVADVFRVKTIEELASHIRSIKEKSTAIPLTHLSILNKFSSEKPNLFMIHPGHGGSEVYFNLAQKLDTHYNCYGIDNYNLNNANKLETIEAIANNYLGYIQDVETKVEYNILGWSLGGNIAMQVAGLLNEKGYLVNLYLLDSYLPPIDGMVSEQEVKKSNKTFINEVISRMRQHGIDDAYIEKIQDILPLEYGILLSGLSILPSELTKIKLFKAIEEPKNEQFPVNNWESIITIPIEVIPVNSNHYNIVDELVVSEQLLNYIR